MESERGVDGGRGSDNRTADLPAIRQLILIFRRQWRVFAATWVLILGAGVAYTLLSKPLYRPQATLEIRPEMPLVSSDSQDPALLASRSLWENYYRTQEALLMNSSLHSEVLKALPETIRRRFEETSDALQAFSDQVEIEKVRSSFILKVGFTDPDPKAATEVVTLLVARYMEEADRHLKESKTGAARLISNETLPRIKRDVEDADQAIRHFLGLNGSFDPQEQYGALADSRRAVIARRTQVRLKQLDLNARIESLKAYLARGPGGIYNPAFYGTKNLELLVTRQEAVEAELTKELEILKDNHPTIIELRAQLGRTKGKIEAALQGTIESLTADMAAAEEEQKGVLREQQDVESRLADASQKVSQYKRLDAELAAARDLYNAYLKKQGELQAMSGTGLGSVRVIDQAKVPLQPFRPNLLLNGAVFIALGAFAGLGMVLLFEKADGRIRSATEIEAFVGLDVVATVPTLRSAGRSRDKALVLTEDPASSEFEAFRGLRAAITTRMEGVAGCRAIAILSSTKGEGKTTVAANLATALALDGRKVLLLDADLRRPTMWAQFGSDEHPDLGQTLRGEATVGQAILENGPGGVDILGMATGSPQAAELAGSEAFTKVLDQVRELYEFIIVDTPPVIHAAEAPLLARRCDAAVLVLRELQTDRAAARSVCHRLAAMRVSVLGAVLNGADQKGVDYGYGNQGYAFTLAEGQTA